MTGAIVNGQRDFDALAVKNGLPVTQAENVVGSNSETRGHLLWNPGHWYLKRNYTPF